MWLSHHHRHLVVISVFKRYKTEITVFNCKFNLKPTVKPKNVVTVFFTDCFYSCQFFTVNFMDFFYSVERNKSKVWCVLELLKWRKQDLKICIAIENKQICILHVFFPLVWPVHENTMACSDSSGNFPCELQPVLQALQTCLALFLLASHE